MVQESAMNGGARGRSNQGWIEALSSLSPAQDAALADLRAVLLRSAFFYLRRHSRELKNWGSAEIEALAEDAAQEACLQVLNKLDTFRGEARFLTWACKFGVGCALVTLRKRQ